MSGCSGCTRRAVLQGIGASTALALAGCNISFDEAQPAPDANEPPVPCDPGKVCLDLTRASSAMLATVGGSLKVSTANDTIIVVRTGETTFEATSAICTHRRCSVAYNGTVLRCPCHGSQFTLEGAVVGGPATVPLKPYETAFDPTTNILSIILA